MGAFIQRHGANLRHIRTAFPIDPRVERGTGQIAPWLSGIVQLVHPAFPGAFLFNDPEVRSFPNPAVGANFSITIPPNEAWGLRAISFIFTTDVNVANRDVRLTLDDSVNTFYQGAPAATIAASLSRRLSYGRAAGNHFALGNLQNLPLPDLVMDTGWRILSSVVNIQVGDQISGLTVLIDVFPR